MPGNAWSVAEGLYEQDRARLDFASLPIDAGQSETFSLGTAPSVALEVAQVGCASLQR